MNTHVAKVTTVVGALNDMKQDFPRVLAEVQVFILRVICVKRMRVGGISQGSGLPKFHTFPAVGKIMGREHLRRINITTIAFSVYIYFAVCIISKVVC